MNQPSLDFEATGFFPLEERTSKMPMRLFARPALRTRARDPRARRKIARERGVRIKEETALANAPTKPNPSPTDAIAAQGNNRNLPRHLAHGAPRVPAARCLLHLSLLRLPTTLPLPLALARVTF